MHVDVTARGDVGPDAKRQAREAIGRLDRYVDLPVLRARVVLRIESNPRIERPARAEGEIDLNGPVVRGHVAGLSVDQAIEHLSQHLERQLRRYVDRRRTERDRPSATPPGEWRHGDWSPPRPSWFPRPSEEREIVRRKTFAVHPMTASKAAEDLVALDHAFFLFRERESGADAVVYWRDDGRLGVIGPRGVGWSGRAEGGIVWEESRSSDPTELRDAVAEMDELDHRFLFFVDAGTDRGAVIYLRYDGHYGLIEPA